uniref:Uncharacterized protein n=1 Tax=Anopheles merus TaxID=30066 RepID=A0A182UMN3_ANOME
MGRKKKSQQIWPAVTDAERTALLMVGPVPPPPPVSSLASLPLATAADEADTTSAIVPTFPLPTSSPLTVAPVPLPFSEMPPSTVVVLLLPAGIVAVVTTVGGGGGGAGCGWLPPPSWPQRLAAISFGEVAGVRMPRLSYLMLTGDTPADVMVVGDTGNPTAGGDAPLTTGSALGLLPTVTVVPVVTALPVPVPFAASTSARGTLWVVTCVIVSVDGLVVHVALVLVVVAFVPI